MSALKKAATAIKEGYEAFLKGHKGLTISHKSTEDGAVNISIKGAPAVIDATYKALTANTHEILQTVQPERTVIHSAHLDITEGTGEDKDKHISIHHIVTTY